MTEIFAILWDLDGVLVDSRWIHYTTWKEILPEYGIELSLSEFDRTFGMNNKSFLSEVMPGLIDERKIMQISEDKEKRFRANIQNNLQPLPGAIEWLQRFHSHGLVQFIASSAPKENIIAQINGAGLTPYLDGWVSGSEIPGKPAPDVFLQAAAKAGFPSANCLVFEDAPAGIQGARRAGMRCVGVATTHPAQNLSEANLVVQGLDSFNMSQFEALIHESR